MVDEPNILAGNRPLGYWEVGRQILTFASICVNIVRMEVFVTSAALQQYAGLPRTIQVRVLRLVERLEKWPQVSGAKPLSGKLAGRYRLRTGDYRLQFRVGRDAIVVEQIGHRDGFYDE